MHGVVEELENPAVLSKSGRVGGHRRLSVIRRVLMEGMAFMSGDAIVVVDIPKCPISPADVPDLGKEAKVLGAYFDTNSRAAA